jgi:hypothetical protein
LSEKWISIGIYAQLSESILFFSAKEFEHRRPAIAAAPAGDGLDGAPLDHAHKAFKRVSAFGHADQV